MSLRTSSERLAAQLMAASGDSAVLRAPISKVCSSTPIYCPG